MSEVMSLQEVSTKLNYRDMRSVVKWCRMQGIEILKLDGSNKRFIMRLQFEHAMLKGLVKQLKIKYSDRWIEVFNSYIQGDLIKVILADETDMPNTSKPVDSYKLSENEERHLSRLLS